MYFYCNGNGKWRRQQCPSSTYFYSPDQVCINPAVKEGIACEYDRNINENINKDISLVPPCRTKVTSTTTPSGQGETTNSGDQSTDSVVRVTSTDGSQGKETN